MAGQNSEILFNFKPKRDTYGFTVRPQYIHRYREHASIYKEEEEERVQKWKSFLERLAESTRADHCKEDDKTREVSEVTEQSSGEVSEVTEQSSGEVSEVTEQSSDLAETARQSSDLAEVSEVTEQSSDLAETARQSSDLAEVSEVTEQSSDLAEKGERDDSTEQCPRDSEVTAKDTKPFEEVKTWAEISPYLNCIECMMSARVKKRKNMKSEMTRCMREDLPSIDEARLSDEESEDDDKDVYHDDERIDGANASAVESSANDNMSLETFFPWKEELESLVQGGVPKDLRGEVWQAFVGVRTRRVESYYQELLADECDASDGTEHDESSSKEHKTEHDESSSEEHKTKHDESSSKEHKTKHDESSSEEHKTQLKKKKYELPEKLTKQIEKDLPRTFPGHPALNENGRNSLRRVLFAYARHNPSVGYCQAMNFFAGLLLLMMPEENAFWTLVGIMDDYFEGYFSEEMIESQVDQLIFEDLMREKFPKLMNHLDYLGVDVSWISSPWFLSIFVNMLPWESVLRVWDVILFEGNRVMVFRTALTLMDLYGPTVVTSKDTGDAIMLLQTLAGSTFDSSQLVLTACMGFLTVTEDRLDELREKHRPAIVAAIEDRAKGVQVSKDPKGLATKLYSFKHGVKENKTDAGLDDKLDSHSANLDEIFKGIHIDSEVDSLPDLQEQVVWLKVELCRLLEEKRSAMLRAEELEAAFMEMVKEDNRRQLSARVEQLEKEVAELRQALDDKKLAETAMVQVLLKVEQEQRVTEDARLFAEQQVAAQKHAVHVLQEKYENAMISLAQMEKRAVMAESMLEATLQYESGQSKALLSPGPGFVESPRDMPVKRSGLLSFGLGWRDRNKSTVGNKPNTSDTSAENKPNTSDTDAENKSDTGVADSNGHHE